MKKKLISHELVSRLEQTMNGNDSGGKREVKMCTHKWQNSINMGKEIGVDVILAQDRVY